jgi:hypothetical protein
MDASAWHGGMSLLTSQRNYRPLSALSFAVVLTAIWEYLMIACSQGLVNGGTAGLFWSYIWTLIGFMFVGLSLAEMASMYAIDLFPLLAPVLRVVGLLPPEANTIGSPNLPHRNTSSSSRM